MQQLNVYSSSFLSSLTLGHSSERILHFLTRATSELGSSLNWQETIDQLCAIISPELSEQCSIWWLGPEGQLTEHQKPNLPKFLSQLVKREVELSLTTGLSRLKNNTDSHVLTIPMRFKNNIIGVISLINSKRIFDQVDIVIGEELAQRAAMVLNHAQVYENLKTAEEHLQKMRDMANRASETKSLFLANMSHEIRTPLTAILGFLDLILSNQKETSLQSIDLSDRVKANGAHLLRLIDQILDLSKIESGKIEIFSENVNLGELLREVHDTLVFPAQKKNLELEMTLTSPIPIDIETDPTRLKQILINIIGNAVKFTDHGKVSVAISYSIVKNQLSFLVSDTGIGLTSEQKARIFNPFMQGDASHTKRFGGTGLGLTLAREFAQHMGGDIVLVDSVSDQGTKFLITIGVGPIDYTKMTDLLWKYRSKKKTDTTAKQIHLKGVQVLLAEDSLDNQMIIDMILSRVGAVVDIASDGAEALAKASKKRYDMILMDIQLPVMSGHIVCEKLRANGYTAPIIALTAHALKKERDESMQAGCNDHLTKPIDKDLLISTIKSYL